MKKQFQYGSIFLYASLQFCGHIEEYFSKHSEKCVVYIVQPRMQGVDNLLRVYNHGKLIHERSILSSKNIILYYILWFINHWLILLREFTSGEKFVVLSGHPITFFGLNIQRLLRKVRFAYWVGDYFPPVNNILILYEKIKRFYHDCSDFQYYLSDKINSIFNEGKIVKKTLSGTVMWGVKPVAILNKSLPATHLLSVGLIKESQGFGYLMDFLNVHKSYKLSIIGFCEQKLYKKIMQVISRYRLGNRIFFPNNFYSEKELTQFSKQCHIGLAMYDEGDNTATYYTDPGKIKTYSELGLPIVMSRTSAIQKYVLKYHSGEVIERNHVALSSALQKITAVYSSYARGVRQFNKHFYYDSYYKDAFRGLEEI